MKSLSAPQIRSRKRRTGADALVMVTAYDEPGGRLAAAAGVDMILVGDSLGNVVLGQENTLRVTIADMEHHIRAVASAQPASHIVGDMPWMSYHVDRADTIRNAAALVRAGAHSVKLEGGRNRLDAVRSLVDAEIPVVGHIGLTPQSVLAFGGFKVQAKTKTLADQLVQDALALQEAGLFAVVIEGVPSEVGEMVTDALDIPTIGIGAGPATDGQVLVWHDLLGLGATTPPKFVRQYADLNGIIDAALRSFVTDVRGGTFPSADETYKTPTGFQES